MTTNARQRGVELDRLEQDLNTLRVDFERFFSGDLEVPPEQSRESIRGQIASLQSATKTAVDTFRLGALEARFHSWSELFNRRLRNRELQHGPQRKTLRPTKTSDPSQGIVLGQHFDSAGVAPLYQTLYRDPAKSTMDLETFTNYLVRQHQLIRDKTGCQQVSFRIVEEDGKKKLKAKPVREVTNA
jgi:hypothetical protein